MNKPYFVVLLLSLFLAFGNLSAQYNAPANAACESEVANLKEQIRRIILDSQGSLEESDNKLMAALQRINALEVENERLREEAYANEDSKRNHNRRLASRLQESEALAARLSDENNTLRKQMEALQNNKLAYETTFVSELESAQKADRSQLRQQKEAYRLMEANLDHAYKEMVLLKAELRAAQSEVETFKKENQEIRRLANTQKKGYEQQLITTRQELRTVEGGEKKAVDNSLASRQMIDSLKFELASMQRMLDILNHAERVELNRVERIETNEKGLQELKFKLEIREQLLFAREKDLAQRQKELELKEEKLAYLVEKEKELKLLEQRLRHYADPKESSNSRN